MFHPPRDLPMLCGPFFLCPGTVGMHLDASAADAEAARVLAIRLLLPECREQMLEHVALGPAEEPDADRVPFS